MQLYEALVPYLLQLIHSKLYYEQVQSNYSEVLPTQTQGKGSLLNILSV